MRLSLSNTLYAGLVTLTLAGVCGAGPDPRGAIQTAYDRSCEAAGLKYIDGMELSQAPAFTATSAAGERMTPAAYRQRLQKLFAAALSVKNTVHMLSFRMMDARHAVCRVDEVLEVTTLDPTTGNPARMLSDSVCQDAWAEDPHGWRMTARRVVQETTRPVASP